MLCILRKRPELISSMRRLFCGEKNRLQSDFVNAAQELITLEKQQIQAVTRGDSDLAQLDLMVRMAQEKKESTKYALMAHLESHACAAGMK